MKKIILLLILSTSLPSFSQLEFRKKPYVKGTISLKDGKILDGFIKFKNSAFDVRFKENEENKKSIKV